MNEDQIYTLPLEKIIGMHDDAKTQFGVCRLMLEHHITEKSEDQICVLLAELFWANFNIMKTLEVEIEESQVTEEGNVVISEKPLALLQTLIFSKEMASLELNKLSVSTCLN